MLPDPLSLLVATTTPMLLGAAGPNDCRSLERLTIPAATIESVTLPSDGICRVTGTARPSPASHIGFEVRLPPGSRWSGRYYQIGNGGFAGHIDQATLADGAARGDAIAGTDTGHLGDGFDLSWAKGRPDRLVDYGYRSIKATSDAARTIMRAYYGRDATRHYAMGCSNGGRMALAAAARWPNEWDGVIAGAPANPWSKQLAAFRALQSYLRATGDRWIPPSKLGLIHAEALRGCPPGSVRDGLPQRPLDCRIDLSRLTCRDGDRPDCLTSTQSQSLRMIMRHGYLPAAMMPSDWTRWILQPDRNAHSQWTFADQSKRYLPRKGQETLLDIQPAMLDAFRARGGRVISYFGWSDAVISPVKALSWYRQVRQVGGQRPEPRSWYRLFMFPGMLHCQGGSGPTSFGQSVEAPASADDRLHDVRRALEAWVEGGQAPDRLVAHKAAGGGPTAEIQAE
jgi:feruloyl esterase